MYLSPNGKKVKVEKLRKVVSSLHGHGRTIVKKIERMPLSDNQNKEISELVHSIHKLEDGQRELQRILSEAEEFGEGYGQMAKEIWEADMADVEQFFEDQKNNGRNKHVYTATIVM